MFAQQQVTQLQTRLQKTITDAQKKAQERAKGIEAEVKKLADLLGDRASAELKQFLAHAKVSTRDQVFNLGSELVKFGHKIEELAKVEAAAAKASASDEAPVDETATKTEAEKLAATDATQPDTSVN